LNGGLANPPPPSPAGPSLNACWKPLKDSDGRGSFCDQEHVAAFLQRATDEDLIMAAMPSMDRATPGPEYDDYSSMVPAVIAKLANVTTKAQKNEVKLFDSKLNVAAGLISTLMLGYGSTVEEIMLHSIGESSAVADAVVAVWKNKLLNSRVRPTTVIQTNYPNEDFTINDGITLRGKHFQALVRVMPHSEFPSGSSCMCQAIKEFLTEFWPNLPLARQGQSVTYDPATTAVILSAKDMPKIPLTGAVNPSESGYTTVTLSDRCGETRLEGGMHFAPAVRAGRTLCDGMGTAAAKTTMTLVPGLAAGKPLREALAPSPPCAADCCAAETACDEDACNVCIAQCNASAWTLPWFDVVAAREQAFGLGCRLDAVSEYKPFFQASRAHIVLLGMFSALIGTIMESESIYQTRITSAIDAVIWNSFAACSSDLMAIKFGQGKNAAEPLVRTGQSSTDARLAAAVHAVACAVPTLLPGAPRSFVESVPYALFTPIMGFAESLVEKCGDPISSDTKYSPECLRGWYLAEPSPSRIGQVTCYELMFFRTQDAWNSLGTEGNCTAGRPYCEPFADYTDYNPESGACVNEKVSA